VVAAADELAVTLGEGDEISDAVGVKAPEG